MDYSPRGSRLLCIWDYAPYLSAKRSRTTDNSKHSSLFQRYRCLSLYCYSNSHEVSLVQLARSRDIMKTALIIFASLSALVSAQDAPDSFLQEYQEFSASDIHLGCGEWDSCSLGDKDCLKKYMDCNINYNKHPETSEENHKRCEEKSTQFLQQCGDMQLVCTGRAVNGYKVCTGTQDYKPDATVDPDPGLADPSSTQGGVSATLQPPKSAPGKTENATDTPQLKPDFENNEAFQRCSGYIIPDDPCVRELFYLQGSVGRFRSNCLSGDLSGDQVHKINLAYYSKDLFPYGPKCGSVQGRQVQLTSKEYKPVCEKCVKPHT